MVFESEEQHSRQEQEIESRSIGVATTTFYRGWYAGDTLEDGDKTDKVRGDLALQTMREALSKGFQIVVIDGGSSPQFLDEVKKMGISLYAETEHSMSGSRRQAFQEVSKLQGVRVVAWVEPEKISIVKNCLPQAALPILQETADIVIPVRDAQAYSSYPDYQAKYEQKANQLWNEILRKHGLLSEDSSELDAWFGPRLIRNDPKILALFLQRYEFNKGDQINLHDIVNPELWPNATFLPIVAALHEGYKVVSLPVDYRHPPEQTAMEIDSEAYRRKRDVQYKNIIVSTMHLIRMMEGNPKAKLHTHTT